MYDITKFKLGFSLQDKKELLKNLNPIAHNTPWNLYTIFWCTRYIYGFYDIGRGQLASRHFAVKLMMTVNVKFQGWGPSSFRLFRNC